MLCLEEEGAEPNQPGKDSRIGEIIPSGLASYGV